MKAYLERLARRAADGLSARPRTATPPTLPPPVAWPSTPTASDEPALTWADGDRPWPTPPPTPAPLAEPDQPPSAPGPSAVEAGDDVHKPARRRLVERPAPADDEQAVAPAAAPAGRPDTRAVKAASRPASPAAPAPPTTPPRQPDAPTSGQRLGAPARPPSAAAEAPLADTSAAAPHVRPALTPRAEPTHATSRAHATAPGPPPDATAPVDVHIGTIEIALEPAPTQPLAAQPAAPTGFADYTSLRTYEWWGP